MVGLLEEALDGGLLPHQRDDDVAVAGRVLLMDDDVVALENSCVLHRVAGYAQHVVALVASRHRRYVEVLLDVLLRQQRRTRRDATYQWQAGPQHGLLRLLEDL